MVLVYSDKKVIILRGSIDKGDRYNDSRQKRKGHRQNFIPS